jgi:dihydroneopterin aldolase
MSIPSSPNAAARSAEKPTLRNSGTAAAIIKLGGSLAFSPRLKDWLAAIRACETPLIVVPGGGPFADAVREAQPRLGFSDGAAHRMALLAMAQYAEALASLHSGFAVASSLEGLNECLARGVTPIWSPLVLLDGAPDLPESWDVTSDSLALRLAGQMDVPNLIMVKHMRPEERTLPPEELAARDIVDRAFPGFLARFNARLHWLGPEDFTHLGALVVGF